MKKRIMVVDDDKLTLKLCEYILTHKGYDAVTVESGKRCLEYLRDKNNPSVDCILLDIEMPLLNGFNTLSSIRQSEKLMEIPVMFLTATATPDAVKEAIRLGVSSYLKKPFHPAELLEKVEQLLGGK